MKWRIHTSILQFSSDNGVYTEETFEAQKNYPVLKVGQRHLRFLECHMSAVSVRLLN